MTVKLITPKELVKVFFHQVWNPPHNLSAIDHLMTEDYELTTSGNLIQGRENFKSWVKDFQVQLLEARNEVLDIFTSINNKKVVSRWRCSGINNGIFDFPPNKESISFTGIAIWEVEKMKLSRCWIERSFLLK